MLEAIDRYVIAESLQYIVEDIYDYDDWEGKEFEKTQDYIIYKTPKDTTFGAEIKNALAKAKVEVKRESDF